jgi:hypothetical protein
MRWVIVRRAFASNSASRATSAATSASSLAVFPLSLSVISSCTSISNKKITFALCGGFLHRQSPQKNKNKQTNKQKAKTKTKNKKTKTRIRTRMSKN